MKTKEKELYTSPECKVWHLSQDTNVFTNFSAEADFEEITDGGEW